MPDKASSEYRGEAAAAAFDRLLEAEAAAEAAVETCGKQAEDLLDAARERQRGLSVDVGQRVAAWRVRLARKADASIATLDREAAHWAKPAALDGKSQERIARAVARLADELIDGD